MCSVVEIKDLNEYYIHYHDSPESLENTGSDINKEEQDVHPLFKNKTSLDTISGQLIIENRSLSGKWFDSDSDKVSSKDCESEKKMSADRFFNGNVNKVNSVIEDLVDKVSVTSEDLKGPNVEDDTTDAVIQVSSSTQVEEKGERVAPIMKGNKGEIEDGEMEDGEMEMPLQLSDQGGDVEDRGTGYNFGKKWSYFKGMTV
eukprot:GFUD01061872.1.p1 GENE.GFUD01061872.1~~GFUD01061872.1.p1  ORF type:complete len:201 (+),score=68.86 GFUD01061872.1:142-744(+)